MTETSFPLERPTSLHGARLRFWTALELRCLGMLYGNFVYESGQTGRYRTIVFRLLPPDQDFEY